MKAFLMYPDRDVDPREEGPSNRADLTQDLELSTLLDAMAGDDEFIRDVARKALLSSLVEPATILYRQHILSDCLYHAPVVRELYSITLEAIEGARKVWRSLFRSPNAILGGSLKVLELLVASLRRLRHFADQHAVEFQSRGFRRFFAMIADELADDYFDAVEEHLRDLKFRNGVLESAELGPGNKGVSYVLRRPHASKQSWLDRIINRNAYTIHIHERDIGGANALSDLRDLGVNLVANATAQSTDHILSFFKMLRSELAFYLAGINLHARLTQWNEPLCFPNPLPAQDPALSFKGLYDACLTLRIGKRAVGNDMDADGKRLVIITGANQGGKSTFLRSIGLAQLMMQSGMLVPAESYSAAVCDGLFTHYKREEDASMTSGKLDEELARMSGIADRLSANNLLLCNESFASTNEIEGSQIAREIIRALLESGVKVFFVTHLFDLAESLYRRQADDSLFLLAERRPDGRRTFRLTEGRPLPTSFGPDLYESVFGSIDPPSPEGQREVTGATR